MARDDESATIHESRDVNFKLIGIVVLVVLLAVFVAQNRDEAETTFLFFEVKTRHWVSLLVAMSVGVLLGVLLRTTWSGRRKRQ